MSYLVRSRLLSLTKNGESEMSVYGVQAVGGATDVGAGVPLFRVADLQGRGAEDAVVAPAVAAGAGKWEYEG